MYWRSGISSGLVAVAPRFGPFVVAVSGATSLVFSLGEFSRRVSASGGGEMSKPGLDWADQWDPNRDDAKSSPQKPSAKEKMAKAKAAASVGMQKTKVYATIGMQKSKVVAVKVKVGATAGFRWIKAKVQKKPQ